MKGLNLAPGLALPLEVLSDVTAIVGRRGRGKTNTAVVLVEEAHARGQRFCVVDPTGAWWGLRSTRDGKVAGIPCVVFGGKHAMAPLEPTAGKLLAEFVADPTQPSVVLDIKPWSRGEQVRFMADFLATLYQKNDAPLLLVLDEADQVAPQRAESPGENVMLGAAQRLVKLGRVSGFGVVLVTQRPATLNKNVLNMAGILITLGLTGPQDHAAVLDWMKHRADAAKAKEILSSLPGLERGTAWVWAPELDILARTEIRQRSTFDSSATPEHGKKEAQPRALAEVDLDRLTAQIKATIERAKAEDPRELRKTIADLRAELKKKEAVLAEVDVRTKRIEAGLDRVKTKPAPSPVKAEHVKRIEAAAAKCERLAAVCRHLEGVTLQALGNLMSALRAANAPTAPGRGIEALIPTSSPTREGRAAVTAAAPAPAGPSRRPPAVARPVSSNGDAPGGGLRRMLVALAQRPGLNRRQLGLRATMAVGGGSFRTYLSAGRVKGWISEDGDRLQITDAGLQALGDYEPLPEGRALREHWLGELGRGSGAARMLVALAEAYPRGLSAEELSQASDVSAAGGSFRTYLSRLRTLELVTGKGELRASEELFD